MESQMEIRYASYVSHIKSKPRRDAFIDASAISQLTRTLLIATGIVFGNTGDSEVDFGKLEEKERLRDEASNTLGHFGVINPR